MRAQIAEILNLLPHDELKTWIIGYKRNNFQLEIYSAEEIPYEYLREVLMLFKNINISYTFTQINKKYYIFKKNKWIYN